MKYNNRNNTKEERKEKYKKCLKVGLSVDEARRMRDWTNNHINQRIEAVTQNETKP